MDSFNDIKDLVIYLNVMVDCGTLSDSAAEEIVRFLVRSQFE